MPWVRRHKDCPKANPRPAPNGRLLRPAGDVKTVYFLRGGRWLRAGWLCLDCLLFVPDEGFRRPSLSPHIYGKKKNVVTDVKKAYGGSRR